MTYTRLQFVILVLGCVALLTAAALRIEATHRKPPMDRLWIQHELGGEED